MFYDSLTVQEEIKTKYRRLSVAPNDVCLLASEWTVA